LVGGVGRGWGGGGEGGGSYFKAAATKLCGTQQAAQLNDTPWHNRTFYSLSYSPSHRAAR